MQHDSYNARISGNLNLKWTDLNPPYRRFLLQTAADERIHSSVLQRYGNPVKSGNDNIIYTPPILSHELTAYNNFRKINSFDDIIDKLIIPEANALEDAGEVTSLIPKP